MLGTFGDVTFEVSEERVRSWRDFQRSGKARWASHELVQDKPVLQHVGPDLEEIKFSVRFDVAQGLNPAAEIDKLRKMRDAAEPQTLTIGGHPLGKFALESLDESHNWFDNRGGLLGASVSLSLKEYHERGEEPKYRQGLSGVNSLADDARELPWQVADGEAGITDVPEEMADQVAADPGDAGGGFRAKLAKAAAGLQKASALTQQGLQMLDMNPASLADLAGKNPAEAVSSVVNKASSLPLGDARQAMGKALGPDMAASGEKYLGRAVELADTARYANLDWLPGVKPESALGDVSVSRAASLAGKLTNATSRAADLARINI